MKLFKFILIFYYLKLIIAQCSVSRESFGDSMPLLVDIKTIQPFRLNADKNFIFDQNQEVIIICLDANVMLKDQSTRKRYYILKCDLESFTDGNKRIDLNEVKCEKHVMWKKKERRKVKPDSHTIDNCLYSSLLIGVGFAIAINGDTKYIDTYRVCYDKKLHQTQYTIHTLYPDFIEGNHVQRPYYFGNRIGPDYEKYYKDTKYKRQFKIVFGENKGGNYLRGLSIDKGHIVPYSDFLYDIQKESTMAFINVAPQWKSINSGTWSDLEKNLRNYSATKGRILNIVTGTWGTLRLLNDNGKNVKISLEGTVNPIIPIPYLYWKAVYDQEANSGRVYISVNNPHARYMYPVCKNNCVYEKDQNPKTGFIYCCSPDDFFSGKFKKYREAYKFKPANVLDVLPTFREMEK